MVHGIGSLTHRDNSVVPRELGYVMREVIIRCLTVTAVLGGLLLGGNTLAAINSSPMATALQMQQPQCPLGQVPGPMRGFCQLPGMGG